MPNTWKRAGVLKDVPTTTTANASDSPHYICPVCARMSVGLECKPCAVPARVEELLTEIDGYKAAEKVTGEHYKKLWDENQTLIRALEHIEARFSYRDCCKYAALGGWRRRHLKEVAREALKGTRK